MTLILLVVFTTITHDTVSLCVLQFLISQPCLLALYLWKYFKNWFLFFLTFYLFIFREGEGKKKKRERNINVWLPLMHPPPGTWPTTQACALTGNQIGDPLVHSLCSMHWATPARTRTDFFMCSSGGNLCLVLWRT